MKSTLLRAIIAVILVLAVCLPLVACGDSSSDTPHKTPKTKQSEKSTESKDTETKDAGDGLKLISKDEFKALFTPVKITTENVFDYFEITSDDKGYWLTPKDNVISVIARDPGYSGFYCKLTYTGEYEVQYTDDSGNVTNTETITTTQTVSSLSSDGRRIQLSPLVLKYTSNKTYDAPVKSITDITFTETKQTPYSVCVVSDLTPYYNDLDGEKVILVEKKIEGAVVSPVADGFTASGKSDSAIMLEEKGGKLVPLNTACNWYAYDKYVELYGGFAWFPDLIESGYFER